MCDNGNHHACTGTGKGDHDHVMAGKAEGFPYPGRSHPGLFFKKADQKCDANGSSGREKGRIPFKKQNHQDDHRDEEIGILENLL